MDQTTSASTKISWCGNRLLLQLFSATIFFWIIVCPKYEAFTKLLVYVSILCLIRRSVLVQFKSTTSFNKTWSFDVPNVCVCMCLCVWKREREGERWSRQNVINCSRNDNFIRRILSLMILWSISEHWKMSSNVNILFPSLPIQMILVFKELTFP